MVKCRVCAWRMCATSHNWETSGDSAPIPREMAPSADEDHDTEMPDHDNTPIQRTPCGRSWSAPERTGQEEHAECDHFHPTHIEKYICSDSQLEIERSCRPHAEEMTHRNARC